MNEAMTLSLPGAAYLKQLEEPGGRCRLVAYNDGTGTPTIAWGCTHGVKFGDHITEDQGLQMFATEIRGIEDGLRKWCTRPLDQDTWDYCVMFGFNLGWGKCGSFKTAVNGGDPSKMRAAAMLFTHGYSQAAGRTIEWPGLVSRRKQELAYYDTHHNVTGITLPVPVAVEPEAPKAQALPALKPSVVAAALSSRTVRAGGIGAVSIYGILQNWWNELIHYAIPPADGIQGLVDQTQSSVDTTKQLAGLANINIEHVMLWIVLAIVGYMMIRRVLDKREQAL